MTVADHVLWLNEDMTSSKLTDIIKYDWSKTLGGETVFPSTVRMSKFFDRDIGRHKYHCIVRFGNQLIMPIVQMADGIRCRLYEKYIDMLELEKVMDFQTAKNCTNNTSEYFSGLY